MIKLNRNLLLAAALSSGIIGFGACSSASTNTVSTGNTNAANTAVTVNTAVAANNPTVSPVENVSVNAANTATGARPKTNETALSDTAKDEKVGVPECDEYIAKYEACVTGKVPEAQRAAFTSSMETMRKGWKTAATNPQAKAALAGGCKQAMTTAKQSMSAFSCDW